MRWRAPPPRSSNAPSAAISIRPIRARSAAIRARDGNAICVVEDVADLWALERAGIFRGRYHVLGGALSALDGITPERLNLRESSWSACRPVSAKSSSR